MNSGKSLDCVSGFHVLTVQTIHASAKTVEAESAL